MIFSLPNRALQTKPYLKRFRPSLCNWRLAAGGDAGRERCMRSAWRAGSTSGEGGDKGGEGACEREDRHDHDNCVHPNDAKGFPSVEPMIDTGLHDISFQKSKNLTLALRGVSRVDVLERKPNRLSPELALLPIARSKRHYL
jgi:hypothetical protein